ncbi:daptide-type RiPP biosynthesis methyltransferase [Microbacterium paraoxydans]|jgi:SAM-dependent methyltransferase|uniref:Methyltransferase domain-containing protein n=1 Tax=Microbacterium paraoxydans TaxID=199592 RepID=A0A1H1Q2C0_9MICO|nr:MULTISPECIES: daptide-type RiPP biosynthesis methyltransferase [Microbacterium]SDS17546.1 Methyltransferase domain-containing protein [Microbacterium paraoxydans]
MTSLITETVAARLDLVGATARAQDLYAGAGTDFYDRLVGPDRAEIREVLGLAHTAPGPVLDLAAGSGRLTIPLARSGHRVTAVDLSADMLARLRGAVPHGATVECVVADMRDLALGGHFGLVVLGATSITLLDREDRARLYAGVRRHLASAGVFALTIADGVSADTLAIPTDREITVPGSAGDEPYLFAQQIEDDGAARLVNWVRLADIAPRAEVPVLTSRLHVLTPEVLAGELVAAGFTAPERSPVRTPAGVEILLLTTSRAGDGRGRR